MNLTELKEKPIQELVQIAEGMGAENVWGATQNRTGSPTPNIYICMYT